MKQITITKMQKFLIFASIGLWNLSVSAQESEVLEEALPGFSIGGSVDTYFRTNFNGLNKYVYGPDGETPIAGPQAPATAFANDPGFALGMVNVILGYEGEKIGFVADLVFGPRGEEAVFLSMGSSNIVNQLYVYYNVSENVRLTLGDFNTFLGYEVISPVDNFNYSTSYMFSYGPFSHTGLKADIALNNNWSAMLAIMNPTDYTEFDPFGVYTFGAQLGYSNSSGSAYLNLIYGEQAPGLDPTFQIDLTTGWDFSEAFYLGLNTTYNSTDDVGFYGVALYPQIQTSENFAIGLRAEYFKELANGHDETVVYNSDANLTAFTLTGNYTVGSLTIKPELRLDSVDRDVFVNQDLEPIDNLSSFVLAAVYAF
ncbi:porin [Salinimicrobium sp. WS361]|uniref:porin n=1 Tax=Salinimicrobium sp. WS361 TaxID=3425123 RepID=UPI003D6F8238